MIHLAALAVFSGLSLNLLLTFALGVSGIAGDALPPGEEKRKVPLFQFGILFISVLFLWIFFSLLLPQGLTGFLVFFLFFPISALVCMGLEFLCERLLPGSIPLTKVFSAFTAYDGLIPASLIITILLAANFTEAFVLTFFFVIGNIFSILILNEIRRRSTLEWVPRFLRGSPLIFISMGLLSLISASAAGICFKILEVIP